MDKIRQSKRCNVYESMGSAQVSEQGAFLILYLQSLDLRGAESRKGSLLPLEMTENPATYLYNNRMSTRGGSASKPKMEGTRVRNQYFGGLEGVNSFFSVAVKFIPRRFPHKIGLLFFLMMPISFSKVLRKKYSAYQYISRISEEEKDNETLPGGYGDP